MARLRKATDEIREPVEGWTWLPTDSNAFATPADLPAEAAWQPAPVPGTVGAALRALGRYSREAAERLDSQDHWYRTRLATALHGRLSFDGLATICEIWIGGEKRAESRSMFQPLACAVEAPAGSEIALCFRSLAPRLAATPRRARWRPAMIQPNGLRWFRTTALGSMPGWCPPGRPAGPWRPIERISATSSSRIRGIHARVSYDGAAGLIDISVDLLPGAAPFGEAVIRCGDTSALLAPAGPDRLGGRLVKRDAEPWFPHTHGEPVLYPLSLVLDGTEIDLGTTGFRSLAVDPGADGKGFGLVVNGVPVFCRGACWSSADVVALPGGRADYEPWLRQARDAGMNMIRVGGTMAYESDAFFALCDELGLLVWQDMMLANFDYPQSDEAFGTAIAAEAEALLDRTQVSPSLAVLCGGSEVFQQAAMLGAPPEAWSGPVFDTVLPAAVARLRPDIAYVPNTPSGGPLPFVADEGVTHYYGVGAYMRGLDDARRARVRFAAECLAFANLPEDISLAGLPAVTHHPDWKRGVPRDAGAPWDFEDVRDHYLERLYGVSAAQLRRDDPERYFALSRAVVAEVMEETFAEWRRPGSPTRGALVFLLQDLQPGAGWGVIASDGEPKSAWHGLKRAFRPVQLSITDEGVNGLALHVINERPVPLDGRLDLVCWRDGTTPVARAERSVRLEAREAVSLSAFDCLGGFFDISYAYRFGPPGHDATSATLTDVASGRILAQAFHFPLGRGNERHELGLEAVLERQDERWSLAISTRRLAQSVHILDDGWRPSENWFHLAPGDTRRILLEPRGPAAERTPAGEIRAVNAIGGVRYGGA